MVSVKVVEVNVAYLTNVDIVVIAAPPELTVDPAVVKACVVVSPGVVDVDQIL